MKVRPGRESKADTAYPPSELDTSLPLDCFNFHIFHVKIFQYTNCKVELTDQQTAGHGVTYLSFKQDLTVYCCCKKKRKKKKNVKIKNVEKFDMGIS